MRKYLIGQYTYRQWCEWAVEMYRIRSLKKSDFSTIAEELSLTHNFRPAIGKLREKGYAIGLLSGGIDTLLYEMVPDADTLFDRIYINRLDFDDEGIVCGVRTTDFDFDGKVDGLKQLASEYDASLGQTVFVGEGFNDSAVTAAAGLGIAYPPHDFGTEAASDVQIGEDDLTTVVEAILAY